MKKTKLTEKPIRITSPFDISSHKTERTANQKFVQWINQIIKERNLLLGIAEQETVGADRKQPDIVIFEGPKSGRVLPELKTLKEKIDRIISDHISSITSQKLQSKILQKLQAELFG